MSEERATYTAGATTQPALVAELRRLLGMPPDG